MSSEYDDENGLASLPTFKSNPGKRSAEVSAAQAERPPVWESATMADVREAIEAKARELGVPRHEVVANTLDPQLEERFYQALATLHGQPDASAMRFDRTQEAVVAAMAELKELDAKEPLSPATSAEAAPVESPVEPAVEPGDGAAAASEQVTVSRAVLEALLRAADAENARNGATPEVSPENIAEAAAAIRHGQPGAGATPIAAEPGVVKSNVGEATAQMTQGALTAGAALIGGALKGTASAMRKGIEAMRPDREREADPAPTKVRPVVLPRLSEYRVSQIEDQAARYATAQEALWSTGTLPDVRKAIEAKARESGLSVEDVVDKMKPGGEMHELHERFVEACNSPGAADHRKAMNKAIDRFVRQYGQAHEEMLAPEQQGAEYFEGYKTRIEEAKERIFKKAGHMPQLDGEDKTHLEKLRAAVAKIIEKVRELISGFTNVLRGKGAVEEKESVSEPAP